MPSLGGDRSARGVLERQRDVTLLLVWPQDHCADDHGDADNTQQSNDRPGGQRTQRGPTTRQRMGMRVRLSHPVTAWDLLATRLRDVGRRGRDRFFNVADARCEMS